MGKICEVCGKKTATGNKVSHSNRKTRRTWKPNIQVMLTEIEGERRRIRICTSCMKSWTVKKPAVLITEEEGD